MLGYKGFRSNLTCRNSFQYEVGKTYTMDVDQIHLCLSGFHFCQFPLDVLKYYNDSDNKYGLVRAEDKIVSDKDKSVTNQITIVELLSTDELRKRMPSLVIRKNGDKEWYREGKLHRLDGPAIESQN